MIEKLYIECAVLAVATRMILAGAPWIAASVALGGCASAPRAEHARAPASVSAPAPDATPLRRRRCDDDAAFGATEVKALPKEFALGCTFERVSACR